jgi:heptaprenyl diphosphate synthase
LREGVPTLVTLNLLNSTRPEDKKLQKLVSAPIKDEAVVASVLKELRTHPALEESKAQLQQVARDARAALGPLPVNDVTGALFSLCDAIVDRSA